MTPAQPAGSLAGIRVLDLAPLLPGAFTTMWLGDLGADVIKVEAPGGDLSRWLGGDPDGLGPLFAAVNRNKRSIVLDLKSSPGQGALHRLAATADVLIEGFRPGVMRRLRADYQTLQPLNARLVYCSLSGFGQDGPYRDWPGHDLTYLALAGILDGNRPGSGPPHPLPVQVADLGGGAMPALTAILAALLHRERTGEGQFIDVAMMDGALSWLWLALASLRAADLDIGPATLSGAALCYNVYEAADGGFLALGALEPHFWQAVCQAIGRPDLVDFGLNPEPGASARLAELRAFFRSRTLADWLAVLDPARIPCAPVQTVAQMLADPQVQARGSVAADGQSTFPARLSVTPATVRRPPPRLGEHSREILDEIGLSLP